MTGSAVDIPEWSSVQNLNEERNAVVSTTWAHHATNAMGGVEYGGHTTICGGSSVHGRHGCLGSLW